MDHSSLTDQLQRLSEGDHLVAEAVLREVLPVLHQDAARLLNRDRNRAGLTPTELVNEVWLRNLRRGGWTVESREHFYNLVGFAMERVLVDFARSQLTERRGRGEVPHSLAETAANEEPAFHDAELVLEIGVLMQKLQKIDRMAAEVVRLHYFVGYTLREIAEIKRLSFRQTRTHWDKGHHWLRLRLGRYRAGF